MPTIKTEFRLGVPNPEPTVSAGPHEFQRRSRWKRRICNHCYAPKEMHPRDIYVPARPLDDDTYYPVAEAIELGL